MTRKTAREIVEDAYNKLLELEPTLQEIREYADKMKGVYGVVTYSKSKGGDYYFLRLHDTWRQKRGGRVHIDVGYVDEKYADQWNILDTTHLMLDKYTAPDFVDFIKERRSVIMTNDASMVNSTKNQEWGR